MVHLGMVVESPSGVEMRTPQKMGGFLEKAILGWSDKGPTLGHIKPVFKGESLQHLSLEKKVNPQTSLATYTVEISNPEHKGNSERVVVNVTPNGTETLEYQVIPPFSADQTPTVIKISPQDEENLKHRLIAQSRWGCETTYNPYGYLDMERVSEEQVLRQLELSGTEIPNDIKQSVMKSQWFSIDGGRIIIEMRNKNLLDRQYLSEHGNKQGIVSISDADDTIFAITESHKKEYELLSQDASLQARGAIITPEDARILYEDSKITIKGKANERRYTPKLNIALVSLYANLQETGMSPAQAMEQVQRTLSLVQTSENPEAEIEKLSLDTDVVRVFNSNPLTDHMYADYAEDMFGAHDSEGKIMPESEQNMRIIATRGTIEGILGQVHKMHQLQLADGPFMDQGVDMVIYTNDLKAETLTLIPQIFPYLTDRLMRIYDDNTTELRQYYNHARDHHLSNLELIHVRQRGSKRFEDKYVVSRPSVRSGGPSGDLDIPSDGQEKFPEDVREVYDSILPFTGDQASPQMQLATGDGPKSTKKSGEMYPTQGPKSIDDMPDPLPDVLERLKSFGYDAEHQAPSRIKK